MIPLPPLLVTNKSKNVVFQQDLCSFGSDTANPLCSVAAALRGASPGFSVAQRGCGRQPRGPCTELGPTRQNDPTLRTGLGGTRPAGGRGANLRGLGQQAATVSTTPRRGGRRRRVTAGGSATRLPPVGACTAAASPRPLGAGLASLSRRTPPPAVPGPPLRPGPGRCHRSRPAPPASLGLRGEDTAAGPRDPAPRPPAPEVAGLEQRSPPSLPSSAPPPDPRPRRKLTL